MSSSRKHRQRQHLASSAASIAGVKIVAGGGAVRNYSRYPAACRLITAHEETHRVRWDDLVTIPARCDYRMPFGLEVLAVLPLGATQKNVLRELERLGFSSLGEIGAVPR